MGHLDIRNSGIEGQVILGPLSPVEQPGVINHRPYQAIVSVMDQEGKTVAKLQSDVNGRFRITLEPGTYTLRPESPGFYPSAPQRSVTVSENQFTSVRIAYDSGIRVPARLPQDGNTSSPQ